MKRASRNFSVRLLLVIALIVSFALPGAIAQEQTKSSSRVITRLDHASRFMSLSPAQEEKIGREMDADIRKKYKLSTNSNLNSYVKSVGAKLASKTNLASKISFTTLDDPETVNAFAIPGGFIYITTGMINKLSNEAELAAVLGHEIGHVTENHVHARVRNAAGARLLFGLIGRLTRKDLSNSRLANAGQYVVMQKFSRRHEYAADIAGVKLMVLAGYNPRGMATLQDKLYKLSKGRVNVEFLASHPSSAKRREKVESYIIANNLEKAGQILTTARFRTIK